MKKLILFLFVTLTFAACKKEEDKIEPQNAAEVVAGSYQLTSFRYVGGTDEIDLPKLPITQSGTTVSGTVVLDPTSEDNVTLTLTLKATGQQDASIDISNVEVRKRGKVYGLYVDGQQVADADGDNIIFNLSETDARSGETLELKFNAKK
ncbi:putative periplasmic lipoprotein [Spirosoma daeguense]